MQHIVLAVTNPLLTLVRTYWRRHPRRLNQLIVLIDLKCPHSEGEKIAVQQILKRESRMLVQQRTGGF
jgi:hypothetical protein